MHCTHPLIAREGWLFLGIVFVFSSSITWICFYCSIPFWIITLFVLQFFRDPPRTIPTTNPKEVLCPADGRVVTVEKTHDPYRNREAFKISIFMNVFNVHSQRSPVDCVVERVDYYPGTFLNAAIDKASIKNERNAVLARLDDGAEVTFVQIAGLVARRILCYIKAGDKMARGQRYGFIRFGSRVDVYLPLNIQPKVAIGDKVKASETILAKLS